MFLKRGQVVDRYTVEVELGEGGVATVYRVRHNTLGTTHALKVLHVSGNAIRERLVQEGRVQAALRHPNIVAVTDVIDVAGAPGLLMEFIEGPPLDRWLRENRPTLAQAEDVFRGILMGVSRAHRVGLIHRDLKPGNVLLEIGDDGVIVPKVSDFGLAKILSEDESGGRAQTRSGMTMGTPAYMAPEQVRDAKTVDQRADIFALGCILYELCTGVSPFDQGDVLAIFSALAAGTYTPPEQVNPDIPVRLRNAIVGCLSNRREERIPDCATLRQVLEGSVTEPWPTLAPTSVEELRQRANLTASVSPGFSPSAGHVSTQTYATGELAESGRTVVPDLLAPPPIRPESARTVPPPPSLPPLASNATVIATDLSIMPDDERFAPSPKPARSLLATLLGLGVAGFTTIATILLVLGGLLYALWGPQPADDGERFLSPTGTGPPVTPVVDAAPTATVTPPLVPPAVGVTPTGETPVATATRTAPVGTPVVVSTPVTTKVTPPVTPTGTKAATPKETPPAGPAGGSVSVSGDADEVWLEGPTGRVGLGAVPAGDYKIKARFRGEAAISAGRVTVRAGQAVTLSCSADFQLCKAK